MLGDIQPQLTHECLQDMGGVLRLQSSHRVVDICAAGLLCAAKLYRSIMGMTTEQKVGSSESSESSDTTTASGMSWGP